MAKKEAILQRTTQYFCHCCGEDLTPENSREVSEQWSENGLSYFCINCEEKYFDRLAESEGKHLALFHACAAFNAPLKTLVLEGIEKEFEESETPWIFYCDKLAEKGEDRKNGNVLTFFNGETDILHIFGRNFTEKDFAKSIRYERSKLDALPGTPEQRERWGKEEGWTNETYNELDRLYDTRVSSYKGQMLTPQMQVTLIQVAKWDYLIDQYVQDGQVNQAKNLLAMVDSRLASEQMRKKDEKPIEELRLDALTVALEKMGAMENGYFVGCDRMIEIIRSGCLEAKKYDYPVDAADQMLLKCENSMRRNADMVTLPELPSDMLVVDNYGEFEEEESENYRKRREFAKLLPIDKGVINSGSKNAAAKKKSGSGGGRKKKADINSGESEES